MPKDLYAYINGDIIEESKALVSIFDRGFLWGDGVYEITPYFKGRLFRLEDHIDRLFRSLRYIRIDLGITKNKIENLTSKLLEANNKRLNKEGVYKLGHWVTRGMDSPSMQIKDAGPPTLCIFMRPVDMEKINEGYKEGVKLTIVPTQRIPPQCLETRAKVTSKMNQILAELDAAASGNLPLMLDIYGNVTENSVANFFIVRDGKLWTPPERNILEGVTRKVVFELANRLRIPLEERNFTAYDVALAEEFFITSSPICVMPVREVDGYQPKKSVPGPITKKLFEAFNEEI